jgi:hypothetical protein
MKPPLLMRALLLVVAGEAEAECVAGDLEEEFGQSSRSRYWYISQVTRSLLPLLLLRVRSGELSRILLGAVLGAALPLLLLDRLWCLIYSQIPLKDGVDRAPGFLAVNIFAVTVCACISGFERRSLRQGASSAMLAMAAVGVALWACNGSAPAPYAVLVLLFAPAGSLLGSALRRFT